MKNLFKFFSKPDVCTLLVNQDGRHVDRYSRFKDFLDFNQASLGLLAELEQMHFSGRPFTSDKVREKARALLTAVEGLLQNLPGAGRGQIHRPGNGFQPDQGRSRKTAGSSPGSFGRRFHPFPGGDRRRQDQIGRSESRQPGFDKKRAGPADSGRVSP